MTISDAFNAFEVDELVSEDRSASTIDNYRKALNSFLKAIDEDDIHVALLAYTHVIKWKLAMHEAGLARSYQAHNLMKLRSVLTYLRKHGFATLDPAEIKIPSFKTKKTAWLTIEEVRRFLSVIESPRDKAIFGSMFSSGARINELLSLNRNSIVDNSAEIVGKGKRKREDEPEILEFDANALKLIADYLDTRTDELEPLFISRQNRRIHYSTVWLLGLKYAKMADIDKRVATHVFRHSFATDLQINGLDLPAVSQQMRHKKLETTKIYTHANGQIKRSNFQNFHTPVPIE